MSHTYEKLSSNKAKLTFTIPAEQFDEATQKAFLKLRSRINVPGFRRGKAPRRMIETLYGENVFYDEALESLFPDAYQEAVKEYDLKPVDQPEVNVDEIGAGKDLKFTAEVFVKPDVVLGEYKGLEVTCDQQQVTDEMIDARIAQDQERASRTLDVDDRPVEKGDTVNLDYAGEIDGVAFEGGTAENQTLEIGSNRFIPGFEEQMIGMEIGEEKDLHVTFPEEYHAKELAGKDAVFHVKVNGIQVTEKPELDDDFAADISEFDTFAEYRESVVKELTEQAEKNNRVALENAVLEKAGENATIDIPRAMIADEAEYILRDMAMRMEMQGMRMEDYLKYTGQTRDQMKSMYLPEAERRVRANLVIEAVGKAEKVEPTEEEIEKAIEEQARNMGQDLEKFRENLTDQQREYLKENAVIRKTLDLMIQDAKIVEKKDEPETKPVEEEKTEEEKPARKTSRKKKTEEKAKTEEKTAEGAAE